MWKTKTWNIKDKALKQTVDFQDNKIEVGNNNLWGIRKDALNKIGNTNPWVGMSKVILNKNMTRPKEEVDRRLHQFKMEIRSEKGRTVVDPNISNIGNPNPKITDGKVIPPIKCDIDAVQ